MNKGNSSDTEKPKSSKGVLTAGWICFVIGWMLLVVPMPIWTFLFSIPFFIASLVLSIVGITHGRVAAGVTMLVLSIGSVIILPITVLVKSVRDAESVREAEKKNKKVSVTYEPKLELVAFNWERTSYSYVTARGQVKNISARSLKNVMAVVTFYDKSGNFITSNDALIDYNPILPGQTSPFSVIETYNPAMHKAAVEFKHLLGATIATKYR
ncbi:MAG: FxLYD domain-containing protein [candidate division WOR-3 bacterium]